MDNTKEMIDLLHQIKRNTELAAKKVLTISEVSALTGITKGTLYRMTSEKRIPHYKNNGRLLFFDRTEIEQWCLTNKVRTNDEIMADATAHCVNHKNH